MRATSISIITHNIARSLRLYLRGWHIDRRSLHHTMLSRWISHSNFCQTSCTPEAACEHIFVSVRLKWAGLEWIVGRAGVDVFHVTKSPVQIWVSIRGLEACLEPHYHYLIIALLCIQMLPHQWKRAEASSSLIIVPNFIGCCDSCSY